MGTFARLISGQNEYGMKNTEVGMSGPQNILRSVFRIPYSFLPRSSQSGQLVEQRLRQCEQLIDRVGGVGDERIDSLVSCEDVGTTLAVDAVVAVATQ